MGKMATHVMFETLHLHYTFTAGDCWSAVSALYTASRQRLHSVEYVSVHGGYTCMLTLCPCMLTLCLCMCAMCTITCSWYRWWYAEVQSTVQTELPPRTLYRHNGTLYRHNGRCHTSILQKSMQLSNFYLVLILIPRLFPKCILQITGTTCTIACPHRNNNNLY